MTEIKTRFKTLHVFWSPCLVSEWGVEVLWQLNEVPAEKQYLIIMSCNYDCDAWWWILKMEGYASKQFYHQIHSEHFLGTYSARLSSIEPWNIVDILTSYTCIHVSTQKWHHDPSHACVYGLRPNTRLIQSIWNLGYTKHVWSELCADAYQICTVCVEIWY